MPDRDHDADAVFARLLAADSGGAFATCLPAEGLETLEELAKLRSIHVRRTDHKEFQQCGVMMTFAGLLGFGHWFGRNWDAFDECMRDREIVPREATMMLVDGSFRILRMTDPLMVSIIESVSEGRAGSGYADSDSPYPPLWIVLNFETSAQAESCLRDAPGITRLMP